MKHKKALQKFPNLQVIVFLYFFHNPSTFALDDSRLENSLNFTIQTEVR